MHMHMHIHMHMHMHMLVRMHMHMHTHMHMHMHLHMLVYMLVHMLVHMAMRMLMNAVAANRCSFTMRCVFWLANLREGWPQGARAHASAASSRRAGATAAARTASRP